jgi:murein DD-endopeptidase MepM/ murein hydrolase activator NlpD
MPLDYGTIKYVEDVGSHLFIHYTDGKKVSAFSDGRGRYLPKSTDNGTPPPYEPWEPPEGDPPPPGSWLANWAAGFVLTSGFGYRSGGFHYGIDISSTTAPTGLPIKAVADMVVTVAVDAYEGGNSTAGTYVKGHTPDGLYTFTYNHMADQSLAVAVGQTVTAGTQLGVEGATGNVTGTHLHFEIIEGNWANPWAPPYNNGATFVDPLPILRSHGVII